MRTTHEKARVFYLQAVEDIDAPTPAEIAAGTELTDQVPVDGLNVNGSSNNASQAMLGDSFVAEQVGTWSRGLTLTFTRESDDDVARDLFVYGEEGFLVISRFKAGPVDGERVEVYPVEAHEPLDLPSAENEYSKYEVQLAVTRKPAIRAEVTAS